MRHLLRIPMLCLGFFVVLGATGSATAAEGYVFPSTNNANSVAGYPHVSEVSAGPGTITLQFVNSTNSLAFFEYRVDGAIQTTGTGHPVVIGDVIYPGVCVDSRSVGTEEDCVPESSEVTFLAIQKVEVRLALGGERDWDFDWTPFTVEPITKRACKKGGWVKWGFANQGRCIRFAKRVRNWPVGSKRALLADSVPH